MTSAGSSRVSWEACPRCGGRAAVGWRAVGDERSSLPIVEYAVEFDCATGCGLSVEEMVRAFQSLVTPRRPDARNASFGADLDRLCTAGVGSESASAGDAPVGRIHAMELIPGHCETVAEVLLWHDRSPDDDHEPQPWISLRSDDWPMCPATARRLAAALLAAAAVADGSRRDPG